MPPPSLCLNEFRKTFFGRSDAHKDTRIAFIFAYVTFLGMSHMTYCSEMGDTKNAMRARVNIFLQNTLLESGYCIDSCAL
jgi:hypothetical protein